jgi:hypothetical protein
VVARRLSEARRWGTAVEEERWLMVKTSGGAKFTSNERAPNARLHDAALSCGAELCVGRLVGAG